MATLLEYDATSSNTHPSSRTMSSGFQDTNVQNSPRFMSPTVLSASKQIPKTSIVNKGKWINSAAKRVGLKRVANSAPRSRKETMKQQTKGIAFPDKVSLSMPWLKSR